VRALIVGCGQIAGGYNRGPEDRAVLTHALAYTLHEEFALAGCVDPDTQARTAFASKWLVPASYATLDDALSAQAYDVVSVCCPTGTHLQVLERLLDAPVLRVFAEKPLDGQPLVAQDIAERYAAAGRALVVNFMRRWDPEMSRLRDEIAAGVWGELQSVVGWYGRGVVNNGSHLIDLTRFLTGRDAVIDHIGAARDDTDANDPTVNCMLDLDGAPFHMVGCDNRNQARFELTLSFDAGVVEILDGGLFMRRRRNAPSNVFPGAIMATAGERQSTGYDRALLFALDALAAWRPGEKLVNDAADAIPAIALAVEIRKRTLS
jgi:predicted dehydrogenase